MSVAAKQRCSDPNYRKRLSDSVKRSFDGTDHARKISQALTGMVISPEIKAKMSESAKKRWANPEYRKSHAFNVMKLLDGRYYTVNRKACEFLDRMNDDGWNFIHAKNNPTGEFHPKVPYFFDGMDIEKNVWFEYDEPTHEEPSVKRKDINRQNKVIDILGCRFFRYSEKYNILYESFRNGSCARL